MRQCPLKYKECPLKRPLSGKVVRSFEIQVAKGTNGQKSGSGEESKFHCISQTVQKLRIKRSGGQAISRLYSDARFSWPVDN